MKPGYSLDDMRLFWMVARQGSFTKAAEQLAMPVSTLSRRINQLEQALAIRLLHRNAHGLVLTEAGQNYLERCGPLFSELEEISGELYEAQHAPRGKIRMAAPINMTHQWLAAALNRFLLAYPQIDIELSLSNSNLDLMDKGIDLALRVGEPGETEWIARPLAEIEFQLYAGVGYPAAQALQHPDQLNALSLVLNKPVTTWRLMNPATGEALDYRPAANVRLAVDDLSVAAQAVAQGVGIGFFPRWLVKPWLDAGIMVQIAEPWQGRPRPVCLLYRDRANQPRRLRLLIDFLMACHSELQP